jgi:hypothetical protein
VKNKAQLAASRKGGLVRSAAKKAAVPRRMFGASLKFLCERLAEDPRILQHHEMQKPLADLRRVLGVGA